MKKLYISLASIGSSGLAESPNRYVIMCEKADFPARTQFFSGHLVDLGIKRAEGPISFYGCWGYNTNGSKDN